MGLGGSEISSPMEFFSSPTYITENYFAKILDKMRVYLPLDVRPPYLFGSRRSASPAISASLNMHACAVSLEGGAKFE